MEGLYRVCQLLLALYQWPLYKHSWQDKRQSLTYGHVHLTGPNYKRPHVFSSALMWSLDNSVSLPLENTLKQSLHRLVKEPVTRKHDDVIKWKHFPRHWPFVRGIHRSPVNSPPKGQWRGVFLDRRLNKRLSKQSWGWWFETPSRPLWRHTNENVHVITSSCKVPAMVQPGSRALNSTCDDKTIVRI